MSWDTRITLLHQIEPVAFRERTPTDLRPDATNAVLSFRNDLDNAFAGEPVALTSKVAHFTADIDLAGKTLDSERVLRGFRRLLDDCLSDIGVPFDCAGCGKPLPKAAAACAFCHTSTNVRGAEVPPRS